MTTSDQSPASIISPDATREHSDTTNDQKTSSAVYYTSQEPVLCHPLRSGAATVRSSKVEERERSTMQGIKNH